MKEVTCICGWRIRGTEDEIVDQVIAHGREAHGVDSTREEVLALAYDVGPAAASDAAPPA